MFDVLVCNPRDVFYPWWVARMKKDRDQIGKIIVMMTQNATGRVYSDDIFNHVPDIIVVSDYEDSGRDWRDAALNKGIKYTNNKKILFLEQDFLFKDGFLGEIADEADGYPVMGFTDGNRLHPACLLVDRDAVFASKRDFSVDPDVGDHFSKFTRELLERYEFKHLPTGWIHLSGLTQNYRLDCNWHHPDLFFEYNKLSQTLPQPQDWLDLCAAKEKQMGDITYHHKLREYFDGL